MIRSVIFAIVVLSATLTASLAAAQLRELLARVRARTRHFAGKVVTFGVEAGCRTALALGSAHYDVGWHVTGTAGTVAASAACARRSRSCISARISSNCASRSVTERVPSIWISAE